MIEFALDVLDQETEWTTVIVRRMTVQVKVLNMALMIDRISASYIAHGLKLSLFEGEKNSNLIV
jgi:hypothetical protein